MAKARGRGGVGVRVSPFSKVFGVLASTENIKLQKDLLNER